MYICMMSFKTGSGVSLAFKTGCLTFDMKYQSN